MGETSGQCRATIPFDSNGGARSGGCLLIILTGVVVVLIGLGRAIFALLILSYLSKIAAALLDPGALSESESWVKKKGRAMSARPRSS